MCNKSRLECLFLERKLEIVYLLSSRWGSEDAKMSIAPAVKPSRYQHTVGSKSIRTPVSHERT